MSKVFLEIFQNLSRNILKWFYCRVTPEPHPSTSVAFFVTLRFSNLVPYVAILKTFHVKKKVTLAAAFIPANIPWAAASS